MIAPVVTLKLLGGIALERDGSPLTGRATQRRRLAVLGLLATAPNGTVSRDRLLGLLWPEADAESARALLNTAVYDLRRALDESAILSLGDDLSLNRALVRPDVCEFEAALVAGDLGRAVAVYHGPFLDGFFVSSAPGFERWLDATRERLRRQYRQALEHLAATAPSPRQAAELRLRLAAEDPTDGEAICRAMHALTAAGERAAALRLAERHVEATREDVEPDRAVLAFADQMRAAGAAPVRDRDASAPGGPRSLTAAPSRGRRGMALALATTGIVALVLFSSGIPPRRSSASAAPSASAATRVRVAPFTVLGDSSFAYLGDEISGLLRGALDGAGDVRVLPADSGGDRLGLRIAGTVHTARGSLRLRASLFEGERPAPVAEATADGSAGELFRLVDQVAAQLLAGWPGPPRERLSRVAAHTATSMRALRLYLTGERDFRAGRYLAAAEGFRQAVQMDSAFALAHYRLSLSILAADLPEAEASAADAKALRFSGRLSDRDRLLIRAYGAFRAGEIHTASRLYRNLVTLYPDDLEAWHQLGETLFHYNPRDGRSILEAREPFERVLALDPAHWSARWHLAHLAAEGGDPSGFLAYTAPLLTGTVEDATALEIRALQAMAVGDRRAEETLLPQLVNSDELRLFQIAWRSAVFLNDLGGADRIAELLSRSTGFAGLLGHATRGHLSLARGQWDGAMAHLAALPSAQHPATLEVRVLAAFHPHAPNRRLGLESLRTAVSRLESPDRAFPFFRAHVLGHVASALGDSGAAMALARAADSLGGSTRFGNGIRARLALERGRFEEAAALSVSDTVSWFGWAVTSLVQAGTLERWIHAEALQGLGRDESALAWYGSFGEHAVADVVLLAPARRRRGGIYEKLGRPAEAVREYQEFLSLWRDADRNLQPVADSVRLRIRALQGRP